MKAYVFKCLTGCLNFQENPSFGHQKALNWAGHNHKDSFVERAKCSTNVHKIYSESNILQVMYNGKNKFQKFDF